MTSTQINSYFTMGLDATQYRLLINKGDDFGKVFWYDCGWEYSTEYPLKLVLENVREGCWRFDGS